MRHQLPSDGCVARLKVLADPTRLAVVETLMAGAASVGAINGRLGIDPTLLSHHLRVLREAQLVEAEREGRSLLYRLAPGVQAGASGRAIDLGCCRLSFAEQSSDARSERRAE